MSTFQVPKENHPWRRYKNRENPTDETVTEKNQKSVKVLITEIAECWDTMTVITTAYGREGEFRLAELPQSKQAAWIYSFLKRHYA